MVMMFNSNERDAESYYLLLSFWKLQDFWQPDHE